MAKPQEKIDTDKLAEQVAIIAAEKLAILDRKNTVDAMDEYFSREVKSGKFIDTSRIPLICQDIHFIHSDLNNIKENMVTQKQHEELLNNMVNKDQFNPVRLIAYGIVGGACMAMLGALIPNIFK